MANKTKNTERADRAEKAIRDYGNGDSLDDLVDLLTNCRHFCDQRGISWGDALRMSENHFMTEWREAGGK